MKRTVAMLILFISLCFAGCRNYGIAAERGSWWTCQAPVMSIVLISEYDAEGTITIDDQIVEIECKIGPGESEIAVFRKNPADADYYDGDSWLFKGEYRYNRKDEIITITIVEDRIGIKQTEIVLFKAQ